MKSAQSRKNGAVSRFVVLVAVIAVLVAGTALFARNESKLAASLLRATPAVGAMDHPARKLAAAE